MNLAGMFGIIVLALVVWWVLLQKLQTKPWLEHGVAIEPAYNATSYPTKVIGLGVFLVVVTALFSLFAAAYHMRMAVPDWTHLPLPKILWMNTALLAASSIALQCAWTASRKQLSVAIKQNNAVMRHGLTAAGCLTLTFLAGQVLAWRQLNSNGFYFSCSPASAFFYVLSALHGLHLLGGLFVLLKTTATVYYNTSLSASSIQSTAAIALSIKLCALYWHYLLVLWLALYALLALT